METENPKIKKSQRQFGRDVTNFQSYRAVRPHGEQLKNIKLKYNFDNPAAQLVDLFDMAQVDMINNKIPEEVSHYAKEIFDNCIQKENYFQPVQGYMVKQQDINEKMRAILIDWLVDVHSKFKLVNETMFLTVNLIDRYLGLAQVTRKKLQLVGVTCMFIATKYEEIYPPDLRDFVYVTDKAYQKQEILEMEGNILSSLAFNITTTSSYVFLERFAKILGVAKKTYFMARYLLELAMVEYGMLKYSARNIAASALYLSCKIMKVNAWTGELEINTQYKEQEVRPCAKALCIVLQNAPQSSLKACRRKFTKSKFQEVAKIKIQQ